MTETAPSLAGPAPPELAAAMRARVVAAGTSFYWAMRLLPRPRREAMYAIYAFCREVDDIADDDLPAIEKRARLNDWRKEIDNLYAGRPRHLVALALLAPVKAFDLQRRDFMAVIDGMEMDAVADIRASGLAELDLYCDRVASAVGRLSVRIFGDYEPAADRVADALGRALQLTNILRDVAEDAARGRLYLPRELVEKYGVPLDDPEAAIRHEALPQVCAELAAIAEGHYRAAAAAMARCKRKAMRPAAVMGAVYHETLHRLVAAGWRDLEAPVRIPAPLKLWLVARHGLL